MKGLGLVLEDIKNDFLHTFFEGKILLAGIGISGILQFIEKYLFSDFNYLISLLIAIGLDVLAKIYNLWFIKKEKPSPTVLLNKLLEKFVRYGIYLIISFVVVNFEVDGEKIDFLKNFNVYIYGVLIIKEAVSILGKINMKFPKQLQELIDKQFLNKKDENTN